MFLFASAGVSVLTAGDFWIERDYTRWSRKEVLKMLADSPWAQTQSFVENLIFSGSTADILNRTGPNAQPPPPAAGPVGPPASAAGAQSPSLSGDHQASLLYYVRLYSALPVRQAMVQLNALNGSKAAPEAVDRFLNEPPFPESIIIAVTTAPGQDRSEFDRLTTALAKNDTWLVKKNKQRIGLQEYLSPGQAGGAEAYYLFPRVVDGKPALMTADGEFRFITRLSDREINRVFKLSKMMVDGRLVY